MAIIDKFPHSGLSFSSRFCVGGTGTIPAGLTVAFDYDLPMTPGCGFVAFWFVSGALGPADVTETARRSRYLVIEQDEAVTR